MHRQGQGASPLRVRRQGFHRRDAPSFQRRPVHRHTLAAVLPEIEAQVGASLTRIVADRGYRGHNAPPDHRFKVYISGQKRRVTEHIKRELRRRPAVEPVIGHAKGEHRMGRNYSPANRAMRPTPSSPPRDTTSEDCSPGSSSGCRHSCSRWRDLRHQEISKSSLDPCSSRTTLQEAGARRGLSVPDARYLGRG